MSNRKTEITHIHAVLESFRDTSTESAQLLRGHTIFRLVTHAFIRENSIFSPLPLKLRIFGADYYRASKLKKWYSDQPYNKQMSDCTRDSSPLFNIFILL